MGFIKMNLINSIFLVVLIVVSSVAINIAEPSRNMIKLSHPIHHRPDSKIYSRFKDALDASQQRISSIQARISYNMNDGNTESRLFPFNTGTSFVANVSIGTPPVVQYLLMDTGSPLTWTQCKGCDPCKKQLGPMYDPKASSSFMKLMCVNNICDLVPGHTCGDYGPYCHYEVNYGVGGIKSLGIMGTETFTFKTSNISGVLMGCGFDNEGFSDISEGSGILGLGTSELAIPARLGQKFSYCIGDIDNKNPEYHFLVIGTGAIMAGDPSPMILENGFYYVTLEGIMIGDVDLGIDPEVFKLKSDKSGGVIIDSGTTFTYLPKPAYEKIRDEIVRILHDFPITDTENNPNVLCFKGWSRLTYVPPVVLKFANGQTISIEMESLFLQYNLEEFCMLIATNPSLPMGMIGIFSQQYYNVGFDVPGKNIYIYRTDCERV